MQEQKINEREDRLEKLKKIREKGIDPYPAKTNRTHNISDVLTDFDNLKEQNKEIVIVGRLMAKRGHGGLVFGSLLDGSGRVQLAFSKNEIGEENHKDFLKLIDVADFLEIKGICFYTQKGEPTVRVKEWRILSKALLPLPEKWHGLKDTEERLRKRYLDILINEDVRDMVLKRSKFWEATRNFLKNKGFLEVETPVLEATAGGADAKPFSTHHNALDLDVFLRISMGELWQKKLMVAGIEKTFEIGRQFRNEGMDADHLQDYTQMEFYWAYANYEDGMNLVEEMYKYIASETFGTLKFKMRGFEVNLGKKWERYDFSEIIKKYTKIDISKTNLKEIEDKLKELRIDYSKQGFNINRGIDNLWKYCRRQLAGPGFLVGQPVEISPLAKRDEKNKAVVQKFQPIIAGSELGNGYSELNDPVDQKERFGEQQKLRDAGDEEAQPYDGDFIEALEHGMPPTCGFGFSERLFSFLMDKPMRECQIFPLMKPKENQNSKIQTQNFKSKIKNLPDEKSIDRQKFFELLKGKLNKAKGGQNLIKHCLATEACMRELAEYFGEDKEIWGTTGLLHDWDYADFGEDIKNHGIKSAQELKELGMPENICRAISAHNEMTVVSRDTIMEKAIFCVDPTTGLIVAGALVGPSKKIADLTTESLLKRMDEKRFAAGANREIIKSCSDLGLELDKFLDICLTAMKKIDKDLGL